MGGALKLIVGSTEGTSRTFVDGPQMLLNFPIPLDALQFFSVLVMVLEFALAHDQRHHWIGF